MSLVLAVNNMFWLRLMLLFRADPNYPDFHGNTPLHHAVLKNRIDSLRVLLSYGADPSLKNFMGQTALHLACEQNNIHACILLLDSQKDTVMQRDNLDRLPGELTKEDMVRSVFNQYRQEYTNDLINRGINV